MAKDRDGGVEGEHVSFLEGREGLGAEPRLDVEGVRGLQGEAGWKVVRG